MKLIQTVWQHRYDFSGIAECEFCNSKQTLMNGYDDKNFHDNVIPAIKCLNCNKRTTKETLSKISDPGYQGAELIRLSANRD